MAQGPVAGSAGWQDGSAELWPDWLPVAARAYLAHTEAGQSLREIARREGVHASTVLRQVRRFESRRDDPLVDRALGRLRGGAASGLAAGGAMRPAGEAAPDEARLMREAARILPLLQGEGRVLVVAADMDRAVLLHDEGAGAERLAVLGRGVAEAFALRDWIACRKAGRVAQYAIAPAGVALLRRLGSAAPFRGGREEEARFRPPPESPVAVLARRREADGGGFLVTAQVIAAERLREDFELAQMEGASGLAGSGAVSAGLAMDWERMLTGRLPPRPGGLPIGSSPAAARARVEAALAALGPGLGDVVLICCCRLEGLETAERRLGWSARSAKVVLRIALTHLARHYAAQGESGKLMG